MSGDIGPVGGARETIGGFVPLFIRPAQLEQLVQTLTENELSQDPHDFIARHLLHSVGHLMHGSTLFVAVFLLSHGVAKLVLVVAVLR
jgi:uncharacterized membrane protein